MTMHLQANTNGTEVEWTIAPGNLLLETLRRERFVGVKYICDLGECGCFTVLVDDSPLRLEG